MPFDHTCSFPPEIFEESKIVPFRLTHTWTIDNFDSVEANKVAVITDLIRANGNNEVSWFMELKPNGANEAKDTISLYLHLYAKSPGPQVRVFANCDVYILNNAGIKISSKSIENQTFIAKCYMSPTHGGWGWKNFLSKDEHFRKNILSNNKLTIHFEIEFSQDSHALTRSCCKLSPKTYTSIHKCNLSENFATLLNTGEFSDFVISTNGKDFPAHKIVLAARSKYFATIFQKNNTSMEENKQNKINLDCMSENAVKEMLRFIYTGKCENMNEVAQELLEVSEKYDLDELKMICSKELRKALSVANASNMLILADIHNAKDLKNDVMEFIVCKAFEVFSTAGWTELLSNTKLMNELFQSMARRLTSYEVEKST